MPAAYPKPDDERVTRVPPAFGWTDLPAAGRSGPPPELPAWRPWTRETLDWWAALWSKPQATVWVQDGSTLWTLAVLHHELVCDRDAEPGKSKAASLSAEIRAHEDRHGLNPKAMLQLRWRVLDDPGADRPTGTAGSKAAAKKQTRRRSGALKVLTGGAT